MNYLVDVNVWVALTAIGHVHNSLALSWFDEADADQIIFCRVTQQGYLRLLTNRSVMRANVVSPAEAWDFYDELLTDSRVIYRSEPPGLEQVWRKMTGRSKSRGPNFWTDAYLAAFAAAADLTIVTFDEGFDAYAGVRALNLA